MAGEVEKYKAQEVYNSLVRSLYSKNWKFDRFDDDLVIKSGVNGDDLPIEFIVVVKEKNQVVQFLSQLPFTVPEDKRVELAIATSVANYGLVDGSFDYDISSGKIIFRLTSSFRDSTIGDELFEYMILCAASTVDNYNDRFFALCKGLMTIEDFIEKENR